MIILFQLIWTVNLKGNVKVKEPMPEKISLFSDTMPVTCGKAYGHRLNTEAAKQMEEMQKMLSNPYRRRKNNALICYD